MLKKFVYLLLLAPFGLNAASLPSQRLALPLQPSGRAISVPPMDAAKALANDAASAHKGEPLRYAIPHKVAVDAMSHAADAFGEWQERDGLSLWRARIDAPGALSIDLALSPFQLPEGAEVWLSDATGKRLRGPYTQADANRLGVLWTPFVPGDTAYLELLVPSEKRKDTRLAVRSVHAAFRSMITGESPFAKSGSCNVDVVCADGNAHRDQIRAVGAYSVDGQWFCTGQLVNNTVGDQRPLFMTANHCIDNNSDANGMVVYWRYESPTCRTVGSTENGQALDPFTTSVAQTAGATLRATHAPSDTTLVELNALVPSTADPFWLGWDRSESAVASAVAIHHPSVHEKRISKENQALSVSNVNPSPGSLPGEFHWRVADWDLGTTERGSSGSVLLNPDKRLIGVLSGGGAACGNNQPDYYGRLNVAWEGGGSASTRVKDWLDPGATGAITLDGKSGCQQPTISLSRDTATPQAGANFLVSSSISGGTGPYSADWDLDQDGSFDRSSSVNGNTSFRVSYPFKQPAAISLTVTDALGCAASTTMSFEVAGPIATASLNGPASQVCGDGDNVVEPGERWRVQARVSNDGDRALSDGLALFAPEVADEGSTSYDLRSGDEPGCGYTAINMSGATVLSPTASGGFPASDDGYVAGLSVGSFKLFDASPGTVLMSTNGYLSTVASELGGDYQPSCADDENGVVDGRINVLHDDLAIQPGGSMRYQRFANCPRSADVGTANQACTVFEWNNVGLRTNAGTSGNAVIQAILYEQSHEIVYQYPVALPNAGAGATISIQSVDELRRLNYACGVANAAPSGHSVCFLHPSAQLQTAPITLESPVRSVGNLAAGGSSTVNVDFRVDSSASCGSEAVVNYLGSVDDAAYTLKSAEIARLTVGSGSNCQVNSSCPLSTNSAAYPVDGLFAPARSGNGAGLFTLPIDNGFATGAVFTGSFDRRPIWYLVNGSWNAARTQARLLVEYYERQGSTVSNQVVGNAWLMRGDDDSAYQIVYDINGQLAAEKFYRGFSSAGISSSNRTGGWGAVGEVGWGVLFDEHKTGPTDETWVVNYLYDNQGQPSWTLGSATNTSGAIPQLAFLAHCLWCPAFSATDTTILSAGSVSRSFSSRTEGNYTTTITLPAPLLGTWNRNAVPFRMLTQPLSPTP